MCVLVCDRAFLEDLAHGPGAVCRSVRRHDARQHLPRRLRLQERQIRPQAQVSASSGFAWRIISPLCPRFLDSSLYEARELNWCSVFRVAQKREDAVSKEVTRKLSEADNRKMSRKEKDERYGNECLLSHVSEERTLKDMD